MPELPDLPDPDAFPGGWLGLGAVTLFGVFAMLVFAAQGTPAQRREFNESIERAVGAAVGAVGRYLSGRELAGPPRSEATWWRAGAPLPDDRPTETPVEQLGDGLPKTGTPALPPGKTAGARRILRAVTTPVRIAFGALAGLWRVLRVWHRWPRAARSAVRLVPLVGAWAWWRFPQETPLALAAVAAVAFLASATSPAGLDWWRVRPMWTHGQIYGPGLWVALRQILRLDEEELRGRWLSVPDNFRADGARIVLRIPAAWIGGPEAVAAVERVIEERVPGEWTTHWDRTGQEHFVRWNLKPKEKARPRLPDYVQWKSTGDPRRVFVGLAIEGDEIADAIIETQTATPHWGVAGDTGSGKSTVLYIPVVHGRQNGEVIDILDTKRNSLIEAEGFSGVRIHKTPRTCIAAFAEFLVSMMAAENVSGRDGDPALKSQLVSRTLVVDELPTLIKLAYTWWRHGIKGKGAPPFLDWLAIILLQGRSSNHRIVVGTQQFANQYFGGTMERSQIGTRILVGNQDRTSWGVAFGQNTPTIGYDSKVKGRGAYSDKQKEPDADYLYVREIQPSYITPIVRQLLSECDAAPAWFDAGHMAPWITAAMLEEVNAVAATANFLPGGKYGPKTEAGVVPAPTTGVEGGTPSSQPTTAVPATTSATTPATGAGTAAGPLTSEDQEEELPETYTLAQAHDRGTLPWKASTTRTYFKRGASRGIPEPEGISDGHASYYSEAQLVEWLTAWEAWQKTNTKGVRKAPSPEGGGTP
ncbi:type IV secretory system conjugative DNA transfer family protein [Streptomyces jumonjinensis]|uniref:type IV secretory system conjugative DNA transfer family protein n=1 Tax=Streptomyces jumonjinensis TaxID=1945 RepID=UPI0037A6B7EC